MDWATKNVRTLVDVVRDFDSAFPGIYAVKFPADSCWSEDDQRILLNTNFRSTNVRLFLCCFVFACVCVLVVLLTVCF